MKNRVLKQKLLESRRLNNYYKFPIKDDSSNRTLDTYKNTMPTKTNHLSSSSTIDAKKQAIFNRNISCFREVVTSGESRTLLPFLGSLRQKVTRSKTLPSDIQPFNVTTHKPCIPSIKKSVCDFKAPNRSAVLYQQWHHHANRNVKCAIDFEVELRRYGAPQNTKQLGKQFRYFNTKINYEDSKYYNMPQELKCPKLKKLSNTIDYS